METYQTQILSPNEETIAIAKEEILSGGIVGMPTETVYGLAANAFSSSALLKIFEAKGRPQDNPLIVHISGYEMLEQVTSCFSETARKLAEAFWPGPLTMILPKSDCLPCEVTAGLDTVGIRMPSHPVALDFIRACGVPIAAPSANLSGKPSPTKAEHVLKDLNGKIRWILEGGECQVGLESTVVRVEDDKVDLLRPGGITVENLLEVVSEVHVNDGVFAQLKEGEKAASPGMKYKHYSPDANVILVRGRLNSFCRYVQEHMDDATGVLVFDGEEKHFNIPCITYGARKDSAAQGNRLFDALRELDEKGLKTVYVREPDQEGVGLAVYNRLLRSCGFQVITAPRQKPFIVGLTGQTGSGKSTVCRLLQEQNMKHIDCDVISRKVSEIASVKEQMMTLFGKAVFDEEGNLNRKALAKLVFTDPSEMKKLDSVMYPVITKQILHEINRYSEEGYEIVLLDAPTLFESGADRFCDYILSVIAPEKERKQRIMKRDSLTEQEAENRMKAQKQDSFYKERSDALICNSGEISDLEKQVSEAAGKIRENANGN